MTVQDESSFFGDASRQFQDVGIAESVGKRNLVIVSIDTSDSMNLDGGGGRRRIDELNDAIQAWLPKVRSEPKLRDAEIAVITYGYGGVQVVRRDPNVPEHENGGAFMAARDLDLPRFQAGHQTPMVAAIEHALDLGRRRAAYLAAPPRSLQSSRPRIITISDGLPSDDQGNLTDAWMPLGARLRRMREDRQVLFFAFGVAGADPNVMRGLAGDDGFFMLSEIDFQKMLELVLIASSADDPYENLGRLRDSASGW